MITFRVICYGCRGKQINRALLQLHFSSSLRAHISQTLVFGFLFCIRADCWRIFSARESMSVITTWWESEPVNIPGLFSKKKKKKESFFHVITSPSVLLIPLPHNVQRMSRKLATDAGLLQRENTFFSLSCNVPGKPWIWSHYLFNLLS